MKLFTRLAIVLLLAAGASADTEDPAIYPVSVRITGENGEKTHVVQVAGVQELRESLQSHGVDVVRLGSEIQGREPHAVTGWISVIKLDDAYFTLLIEETDRQEYFLFARQWKPPADE